MGTELSVLNASVHTEASRARDINDTIDYGMGHMDALRTKLASQGLAQRSAGEHAGGHGCEVGRAADRRCRPCGDECRRMLRAGNRFEKKRNGGLAEGEETSAVEQLATYLKSVRGVKRDKPSYMDLGTKFCH